MAYCLLPHPRHRAVHDRPRHGVPSVEPGRSPRTLRARLRAGVVVADPRHNRRQRRRAGPRPSRARTDLHLRLESPEHLRHPRHLRLAAVPASHHREGIARRVSVPRLAPPAIGSPAGGPAAPRPGGHPRSLASAGRRGALAHHFSGRHAEPATLHAAPGSDRADRDRVEEPTRRPRPAAQA